MTRRAPLQLLPAPEDREAAPSRGATPAVRRVLAPGAPPSPGPVPLDLARELRVGEPVVWWGRKERIDRRPVAWMILAGALLLGFATLLAPELAPALLVLAREYLSLRTVLVTDTSVLVLDHRKRLDRLAFRNVRRVRRDLFTGGVLLEGARHKLRLPPQLAEDARGAIATQTRHRISSGDPPDDPMGWLP